ncbi:MAG: hypothetical protein A3F40_02335 [Chlamydiae bacterium RIFCSPHIGHO2_12_FULL_27_8]|nr:MAG: hypothetical protein A3F40_02335 [Chlamydiae bacterium RIFCSPHIGHO2_12_FULL_27_8]
MNELIFLLHVCIVIIFLLFALKLGKNYLLALAVLQGILANIFVIKQITLFTKTVTTVDVFIIGTVFAQNLIQEYFGKENALKTIKISFFSMIFFLVMSKIHMLYTPSRVDFSNEAFKIIFSSSTRIFLSSIFVFFICLKLDVYIFGFLQKLFNEKKLSLRIFISSLITQFIDTVLFAFLALYMLVDKILDVMVFSFLIKMFVVAVSSFFINFSKKIIKAKNVQV